MNPWSNLLQLGSNLSALVQSCAFVGTFSWKYHRWRGQIYDEHRYLTRRKFSKKKFEECCLVEYVETFSTVCAHAGYYRFPTEKWLEKLCALVSALFRFSFN